MEKTIFCLDQVSRLQLEVTAKELVLQQVIFGQVQGIYPSNYPLSMQVVDMISRCNRFMKQGS